MNAYLLSVIGTILLAAVVTSILPEGKTASMVKGMTKLICLFAIISPILQYLQSGDAVGEENNFSQTVIETDESFIKYYSELRIRNAETALSEELQAEFDITCTVTISWEYATDENGADALRITRICVQTERECSEEEKRLMCEYLVENYCSEVLLE